MVLQRGKRVPVWGWAAPGAQVEVGFGGQKKAATADDRGYWKAVLDPLTANRTGQDLAVRIGATAITRTNVLVGEVWIAAGQSNMCVGGPDDDTGIYPHHASPGTAGGKPEIRVVHFGWGASLEPQADHDTAGRGDALWQPLPEAPAPAIMGLPLHFARVLRDALDVPVGIIRVAVPGTNQAAWMARETLEGFPSTEKQANFYQEFLATHADRIAKSKGEITTWEGFKQAEAALRGKKKDQWPSVWLPFLNYPTALYNTRIHPLAPLALRGVIWHQGEAGPFGPYGERLVAMARQWRGLFGQDFDFIWGTLSRSTTEPPPLAPLRDNFYRSGNNLSIRQALKLFGEDRHVALVEFYDLGDAGVHFTQKAEAGRRMGLAALTVAYGQEHIYTGPRMLETKIEGGRAVVRFAQVGDGLAYQPSIDGISGVYIRGKTGTIRWGEVKLIGRDAIEIAHPDIADIETVAYADHPNPHETLFNSAGLPASPFTVNPVPAKKAESAVPLVSLSGGDAKTILNIGHVRRGGYMFQLQPKEGKASPVPSTVRGYIPAEWKGYEVESGGKKLTVSEVTENGVRFVTFPAPVDDAWIIIAETGRAAEFRRINRH